MLRVGVTGGAASGKSAVTALLAAKGFPVIDADRAAAAGSARKNWLRGRFCATQGMPTCPCWEPWRRSGPRMSIRCLGSTVPCSAMPWMVGRISTLPRPLLDAAYSTRRCWS